MVFAGHHFGLAVDADCHFVVFISLVLGRSQQHARLSAAWVPYDDYLEHVVVFVVFWNPPLLTQLLLLRLCAAVVLSRRIGV